MKKLSVFIAALIACSMLTLPLLAVDSADNTPAKKADIQKLIKMTGQCELASMMLDQMIKTFKQTMPQVPEKFWTDFKAEAQDDSLSQLYIPIYEKNMTHADIKELIKFYETPAGKRYIQAMPEMTKQSMEAGEIWGRQIAQKVIMKLQSSGILNHLKAPNAAPPAAK